MLPVSLATPVLVFGARTSLRWGSQPLPSFRLLLVSLATVLWEDCRVVVGAKSEDRHLLLIRFTKGQEHHLVLIVFAKKDMTVHI